MNTPTHQKLIETVTQVVSEYNKDTWTNYNGNAVIRFRIAEKARKTLLPIIGAGAYQNFLVKNLPVCLDPNVSVQNITRKDLGDWNSRDKAYFVRSLDWQGLQVLLTCVPYISLLARLHLSIMNNGKEEGISPSSPDVTATLGYDEQRYLYTAAMDNCNGCLVSDNKRLRPLGDAIIQFGVGALEDPAQLDTLAKDNKSEYTARYLLGLPASLTDMIQKAIGN